MKRNICFLGVLLLVVVTTTIAQTPDSVREEQFDFTDLTTASQKYDGYVYVIDDKYYVVDSIESFFSKLNIDPKKDVEYADLISASNPNSKDTIECIKEQLPEKYREFKALMTFYLRK